jgi:hypothetical protein
MIEAPTNPPTDRFNADRRQRDVTLPRDDLVAFFENAFRFRAATWGGDTDTAVLRMPYDGTEIDVPVPIEMFVGFLVEALYRGDTLWAATFDATVKATVETIEWELFTRDHAVRH